VAELERAQQAHVRVTFETISRRVASEQERTQVLYDEAVIIFEATLRAGQKMTGAQKDTLWNDTEQMAMEQQLPLGPVPAEGSRVRRIRTINTKVRVGDLRYNLSC
jgi:hypothetical protein